jgi:ligand-binding SRPBCC domain-containing protein
MPKFTYTFDVDASLEAVSDFHKDTNALKILNPPGIIVQLHRVDPMAEGSISEFTLWFGPFPIRWLAVHSAVSQNGFTDTLVTGPAQSWRHTHSYKSVSSKKSQIKELIVFEHKSGWMGVVTRILFSPFNLRLLFGYRQWATRRALRKNLNAVPSKAI